MNFTYQDYIDGGLKEVQRGLTGSERGPARSDGVREGSSEVCRSVYMTSFYFYFTEHVTNLHTGAKPFAGYRNSVIEEPIVVATSCVMDSQSDNTLKVGSNL